MKSPEEIADRWCGSAGCDAERVDPGFRHKTFAYCSLHHDVQTAIRAERERADKAEKERDALLLLLEDHWCDSIRFVGSPQVGDICPLCTALRAGKGNP